MAYCPIIYADKLEGERLALYTSDKGGNGSPTASDNGILFNQHAL